ncbi:hypothetical protein [Bifidobacterium sp. ESL0745]|uniref:hypothetical protein n=1 Tax=Bifidobacterium sp. ESL0745 TaxID=2983226 RepID=UPI0023F964F2|nr:hypothetical protein [Bifidobacterium sp. ESL0745]MDF7665506.1 hypothetical protein [Bifidobacterium sp. ESL0745]
MIKMRQVLTFAAAAIVGMVMVVPAVVKSDGSHKADANAIAVGYSNPVLARGSAAADQETNDAANIFDSVVINAVNRISIDSTNYNHSPDALIKIKIPGNTQS